ncbi:MAG: HAMP domain-containing histidine kinase [Treponema sp.]|jgi:signal transduction histidine kinase|nr:HAMP domain-containing histidine kinase [Treponema sp.]
MTIKRRMFISHILMICIPFVLSVLFSIGIRFVIMKIYGNGNGRLYNNEIFHEAKGELLNIGSRFTEDVPKPDSGDLKIMAGDLQNQFRNYNVFFAVYENGAWLMPPPRENKPLFDAALSEAGNHLVSFDTTAAYIQDAGTAKIMAVSYDYHLNDDIHVGYVLAAGILSFWIMILLILGTNFFLTRGMIKNISVPLNMLSFGVEQIQNNNLGFRLEYKNSDEFFPVCGAFNKMTERLEAMAAEHDKYEENRRELLAGISHDLRTPLTSIKAYLEGIEKEIASTREKREKYIAVIRNKTGDMEHIISQLFLFSKLDLNDFPLSLKNLDMGLFIRDLVSELADDYAGRGLAIALSETPRNAFVSIDPILFHNVVTNILENSVSYKAAERGCIEIRAGIAGAVVEIRLADDGPGVSKESLEKLFDVFYRADPSRNTGGSRPGESQGHYPGSGLGLAISQKIVNRMGGSINAELPGRGLAIVISVPLVNGETACKF